MASTVRRRAGWLHEAACGWMREFIGRPEEDEHRRSLRQGGDSLLHLSQGFCRVIRSNAGLQLDVEQQQVGCSAGHRRLRRDGQLDIVG
jgi:hypothetical protein